MTNEEKYTQAFMQTFEIDESTAKNLKLTRKLPVVLNFRLSLPGTPWGIWDLLPLWKKPSTSCSNLMILWI